MRFMTLAIISYTRNKMINQNISVLQVKSTNEFYDSKVQDVGIKVACEFHKHNIFKYHSAQRYFKDIN